MESDTGFDDLFDGPSFKATRRLMQPSSRPKMWPSAVTDMRQYTSFGGQGIASLGDGDGHHKYVSQRGPPLSKVQLLAHISAVQAQHRSPTTTLRSAPYGKRSASGKRAQPSADRRQWSWRDTSSA